MPTLKSVTLTLLFAATSTLTVLAQAPWQAPLVAQLAKVEALSSNEGFPALVPAFERIAAAHPKAVWPQYYAAHYNLIVHWTSGEDGCATCVEKADAYITAAEKLAPNDSEVMTMRARYYQAMTGMHPMRAPYYGPKATNLLEDAVKADPSNPRAMATLGSNLYYTPSMFGGGAQVAQPYLQKADTLFAAEAARTDRPDYLPRWSRSQNAALLAKTSAVAAQ